MVPAKNEHDLALDALAYSNVNSLWGAVTAEILVRLGCRHAVISPGSRSTPLTFAFSRHPKIDTIPILDERSASFFALGLARQTHQPVVLVCTSGTAAANFYPAVIEARLSQIPLLVMTADRPPEMRYCHSGQTIDQLKLFADYPRFFADMALPEATLPGLTYLRQTLHHAWQQMQPPHAGPVHLNCPFRDPLSPESKSKHKIPRDLNLEALVTSIKPARPVVTTIEGNLPILPKKGIILAGQVSPEAHMQDAHAVAELARKLGYPVLADALGPWRNFDKLKPYCVAHYDCILRNHKVADKIAPDAIVQIGPVPASKLLRQWLERSPCPRWIIHTGAHNLDTLHSETHILRTDLEPYVRRLKTRPAKPGKYLRRWMDLEAEVASDIDREIRQCDFNFEGKVVWTLAHNLPTATPLCIASSMPVRDMEFFWPAGVARSISPVSNRGANGIDGTLSTALGHVYGNPYGVLLTGDLALLHDSNGFLIRPKFKGHLTIVLNNNAGGGIFETLPIARHDPPFEDYFATPQQTQFGKLAEAHGIDYMQVAKMEDLARLCRNMPAGGIRLLEVVCDRKKDTDFRRSILEAAAAKLTLK